MQMINNTEVRRGHEGIVPSHLSRRASTATSEAQTFPALAGKPACACGACAVRKHLLDMLGADAAGREWDIIVGRGAWHLGLATTPVGEGRSVTVASVNGNSRWFLAATVPGDYRQEYAATDFEARCMFRELVSYAEHYATDRPVEPSELQMAAWDAANVPEQHDGIYA